MNNNYSQKHNELNKEESIKAISCLFAVSFIAFITMLLIKY